MSPALHTKQSIGRTPDEGFPSFFAKQKKFTLSCVLGRINYGATRPKPPPPFEKGGRKLSSMGLCEQGAFNWQKIKPMFQKFLKVRGCGGKKSFFQEVFSPPHIITYNNQSKVALSSSGESGERYAGGMSRTVLAPQIPSALKRYIARA